MALTKVDKSVSSTPGIVDNSDATAITIDSSERVGIGTSTLHKNLNIHTSDSNSTNIVFTNSTTGTGSNDGFYIGIDSNESPEFWNYENTDFIVGLNNSEKFRIKADGNVLIGSTTSIASNIGLQVTGSNAAGFISLFRDDSSIVADDDLGGILFYGDDNSATTQFAYMRATAEGTHSDGDNPTALRFGITLDGSETPVERFRINSSGNAVFSGDTITVGDSHTFGNGAGDNLHIESSSGENLVFNAAGGITVFQGGGTERMRIDSSGILLKGKTTAGATSTEGFEISNNGLNQYSTQTSGAVTSTMHVLYGSTFKYYVGYDGQVYASNTSITSLSDERLKENVKDLDTGLSDILELKPKRFDWKEGEGTGEKNVSGFIAQDVEDTNFSDLVGNFKHNSLDDCKSFQYSGLIPALVKSIQEQQEQIEALQSEINTLKGGE